MADSASQSAKWFESLKGVTKSTGRNSTDRTGDSKSPSPARHSYARRVSPVHDDVESAARKVKTTKSEAGSSPDNADSSFSFSRSFLPLAQARNSPDSRAKHDGNAARPKKDNLAQARRNSPDSRAKNNGTAARPKKDKSSPPQLHPAKPSAPPLALPLPPAISSPLSSKSLQYPVGKDFLYEPSTKFDLGPEPRPRRSRRCCYCFLTIILVLLLVMGILVGIMAVKLKPKQPSLSIGDDLRVTSLNFSEPGGVPLLEMGLNFSLSLNNPNKHAKVIYSQISATIYYNNTLALGSVDFPGFTQGDSGTKLLTSGNIENVTSVPADTVVGLREEVAGSNVQINLRGSAGGKSQVLWFKVKPFSLPIDCQLNVKPGVVGQQAQILNKACYD